MQHSMTCLIQVHFVFVFQSIPFNFNFLATKVFNKQISTMIIFARFEFSELNVFQKIQEENVNFIKLETIKYLILFFNYRKNMKNNICLLNLLVMI